MEPLLYTEKGFRLLADLADEDLGGWKREVVLMQVRDFSLSLIFGVNVFIPLRTQLCGV